MKQETAFAVSCCLSEVIMKKKNVFITASVLVFSVVVTLIDAFVKPDYFVKIPIKILFFLALPMVFFLVNKKDFKEFRQLFVFKKSGLAKSFLLGFGVYGVIVGGYFLTKSVIDFSNVTSNLTESMGITADHFIFVFLYISLMNSFLEEFFFRGYGFITLKKYSNRKFAYIFSSTIFAVYHVGMLLGSFNFGALLLLLVGLIMGGCIFNYLNEQKGNIYSSWCVHMFANFGINTVGMILFGVL